METANLFVRDVPEQLKERFKAMCASLGLSIRDRIIWLMDRDLADSDRDADLIAVSRTLEELAEIANARMSVAMVLGEAEMRDEQIASLEPGTAVRLDTPVGAAISLVVAGRRVANAEVMVVDGCYSAKIHSKFDLVRSELLTMSTEVLANRAVTGSADEPSGVVTAIVAQRDITFGELLNLQVGAVLDFGRPTSEPVELFAGTIRIARGVVTIVEGYVGIMISVLADGD